MRDLLIATLTILLLIGGWLTFIHYADSQSKNFQKEIEKKILPEITVGNWEEAESRLDRLNKGWHKFRKISLFFLDTHTINEIDFGLAKSIEYAHAQDVSNSTGELAAMVEQLSFLTENESLSLQNVF
ncbi:MAG: DUF4363 family protein [Anaerovoracaceae bacterium]